MLHTDERRRIRLDLSLRGYAALAAGSLSLAPALEEPRRRFVEEWENLCEDRFMGDGGRYRQRRYGRFLLEAASGALQFLEGTSIYQSLEDNPLNGGVLRTFEQLTPEFRSNPFLLALVAFDYANLPLGPEDPGRWTVGVHQIRITAQPREVAKPSPEGIHIDAERFTVQHLVGRHNVTGGLFSAYDQQRSPVFEWLQHDQFDSVYFTGETLHGASPIRSSDGRNPGCRDILLIDFDPFVDG